MVICCLSLIPAYGQSSVASLSGQVADQDGAIVPGAAVMIVNPSTGFTREVTTNDHGSFTVPFLPPATYTITVRREGFAPIEVKNVVLNVGDQKALQIQLKAGDVNATVLVTDEAPLINESPAVATVIDRQFVDNLPLNGRSFQSLISLSPGVVTAKSSFGNPGQFSVNGQRTDTNYFTIDGVSANFGVSAGSGLFQTGSGSLPAVSAVGGTNNLVSVDALQEFKIQTSTYAPEFGRTPGGQVQILTRSGTNGFHGTVFEYFRNDALDATDWFVNANRLPKPALRQNQFGGVLGGPLPLPRIGEGGPSFQSGKDRTFFFFSYEGLRLRLPQVASRDVPSLEARRNPSASEAVRQLLNSFPIPTGPTNPATKLAGYTAGYSDPSTFNSTSLRIDHSLSDKLTIFARFNYAPSNNVKRASASNFNTNMRDTVILDTQTLTGGATWIVSSSVSNEFRANWSKSRGADFLSLDGFGGAIPSSVDQFLPASYSLKDSLFAFVILGGGSTIAAAGKNVDNRQRQLNLIDNLSIGRGSHQLKFGVDYRRLTPVSNPNRYQQTVVGDIDSYIAGKALSVSIFGLYRIGIIAENFSAYAQDTWKASKRLTLTYGLRWELNPAPKGDGKPLYTVQGLDAPANLSLAPAGTPFYKTTYNNFAPRFGVSYQLGQVQGRETVIRGGFGLFYDLGSQGVYNAAISFPYRTLKSLANVPFPLNVITAAPLPLTLAPPVNQVFVTLPDLRLPRTYQWNLTVEKSLGKNQTLSAAYVASLGRELLQPFRLMNPNANFSQVNVTSNQGDSNYRSMQLQFTRRFIKGTQFLSSYTWAKSVDTGSNDIFDNTLARGPSDFDVRHAFSAALTCNLPTFSTNPVVKALLHHWAVDGIVAVRSATPFNLVARTLVLVGGVQQNIRPDLITGAPIYLDDSLAPGGKRLNPAAFAIPPAGRQGTLARNAVRGFPVYQVDLAFRRRFNLSERLNVELRAEFFNIFNHPNFADPVASLTSTSFGRSTQMLGRSLGSGGATGGQNPLYQVGGPRSVQLALKIHF
jgi:outer membrane receptor protein involved in Fe transport